MTITEHIYTCLLERYRTTTQPKSPITGLLNTTYFGRPDFHQILDDHYEEMVASQQSRAPKSEELEGGSSTPLSQSFPSGSGSEKHSYRHRRVGVFYCGAAALAEILADKCRQLTAQSCVDGTNVEYHLMLEVFG